MRTLLILSLSLGCTEIIPAALDNPVDPRNGELDRDGDGVSNWDEVAQGSDPRSGDSDGDGVRDNEDPCPATAGSECLTKGVCASARAGCPCADEYPESYEETESLCDGLDNDCDGETDEDLTAPAADNTDGVCAGSVQVCTGTDGWTAPDLTAIAGHEDTETTCDGLDNDCDGETDEVLTPPPASKVAGVCADQTKTCTGSAGWVDPDFTALDGFEVSEVSCDGIDNDCDGDTDPMLANDGCLPIGVCATANFICDPDNPLGVVCVQDGPVDEICDGLDNDCDGEIDEELEAPEASLTAGVCDGQVKICSGAEGWTDPDFTAIDNYEAIETICGNHEDNDCDGEIDEGIDAACDTGADGICGPGIGICDNEGQFVCEANREAMDEACSNDEDDDCDGEVDEQDGACNGCPDGTIVPEGWVCVPPTGPNGYLMGFDPGDARFDAATERLYQQHTVRITRPFLAQATEVTQADFDGGVDGAVDYYFSECGDNCPASNISWYAAVTFANDRSDDEGLDRCYVTEGCVVYAPGMVGCSSVSMPTGVACSGYRLPTEAEWEYMARAGTQDPIPGGAPIDPAVGCLPNRVNPDLDAVGWYCANSEVGYAGCEDFLQEEYGGIPCAGPHPVGEKAPNPWGLYDLHGNVAEWVWDWWYFYELDNPEAPDPTGVLFEPVSNDPDYPQGYGKVVRGGAWYNSVNYCTADSRSFYPDERTPHGSIGFRLVRTLMEP